MRWEQHLVDAQVDINRAVLEMNRESADDPHNPAPPNRRYINECAHNAIENLRGVLSQTPPVPFTAATTSAGHLVMRGAEVICRGVVSKTMAQRIANALNWYPPGRRGS